MSFAAGLLTWGLLAGERVALFANNHPDFLAAYLGTQLAGGVVVPVNTRYRRVELEHISNDAEVRLCVTDPETGREIDNVRGALPRLQEVIEIGSSFNDFLRPTVSVTPQLPSGDDLAMIAYTSGTTVRSKGAMLLHRNLLANVASICEAWRWTSKDRLLLTLPLFHMHGLWVGALGTLFTGASVVLHRKFDPVAVYDALLAGEATMFFGVPTMYERLLREAKGREERPDPIRLYVSGSAPLSPSVFSEFEKLFGERILERYGMTETGMNLTNPYDGERRPGTVGGPFPRQEARVVDLQSREPVLAGKVGEIEIKGPHVFSGYLNRPEATVESFGDEGWFKTGDLGWVSEDGYYTISGRAKELIISGGFNVYPREVEEVLERCAGVAEVAIVGLPDEEYGERVVAAVVRDDPALTPEAVVGYCRENLASFKKPREVVFVDSLPRNALGKVLKHEVRRQVGAE
jgi:malonyl-CoA/methylmalonyl-CoA synthetase